MRAIPPALQARLDAGATTLCACWRVDRRDGAALGFTDHDEPLSFDGLVFAPEAALEGSAVERATGLAPDSAEAAGALRSDAISAADVARGLYDGAKVRRWMVDWTEPDLRVLTFAGEIGDIERDGHAFRAELLGPSAALNRPLGRAYLPRCDARLGDARCGVDAEAFAAEATVVAVGADGRLTVAGLEAHEAGWFADGEAAWLTGANAGDRETVASDAAQGGARLVRLWSAPAADVRAGDRLRLTAGCDKRVETCRAKFGNAMNFRGFPHMPGEDWVVAYPRGGEAHDGGSRRG